MVKYRVDTREMKASTFKATCLALLDEVAETKSVIVVTKHGKPLARLVPYDESEPMIGSVSLVSDAGEDYFSTGESWNVS